MTEPLRLELPAELIEQMAERVSAMLAERHAAMNLHGDRWLRGADVIADYIGAPRSRVYALASCTPSRIPVERDGSALIAKRSTLDAWLENGGGRRP